MQMNVQCQTRALTMGGVSMATAHFIANVNLGTRESIAEIKQMNANPTLARMVNAIPIYMVNMFAVVKLDTVELIVKYQ